MERVVLKADRERSLLRRHPWVFSGSLEPLPHDIASGETVEVATADGEVVGLGWWSAVSNIRVRMLAFGPTGRLDALFLARRVGDAVARRDIPAAGARRLVNAENDGLPGVVADFYAGWVVCQFTCAGAEAWRREIADALMKAVPGCRGVAARCDADGRRREHLPTEPGFEVLAGEAPPEEIEIEENGLRFLVDVRRGHKTGFYLDQREARAAVGRLAAGRDVLNCFCYTGGFGLYAAANGARSVVQVDASQDALALAARNEKHNRIRGEEKIAASAPHPLSLVPNPSLFSYIQADVFKYLRQCRDAGRTFDMIVLDPPKFADNRSQIMKAARGYKDINLLAMKLLRPGGVLATFSCSGAMTAELFDQVLAEAAADARRDFQIIGRTGHAPDHPVALSFPEGRYLKGVILRATGN